MKCVDCGADAEYQYKGNSYCEKCHIKHKRADQADQLKWKALGELINKGFNELNELEANNPVRAIGKILSDKREEDREWREKIKKKKPWWEQDLR